MNCGEKLFMMKAKSKPSGIQKRKVVVAGESKRLVVFSTKKAVPNRIIISDGLLNTVLKIFELGG